MLKVVVIKPAHSKWAILVVFVPETDGKVRLDDNYRRHSEVNVRNFYSISQMDDCVDSLAYATVFTTLKRNSGYWPVGFQESGRDMITFRIHQGMCCAKSLQADIGTLQEAAAET